MMRQIKTPTGANLATDSLGAADRGTILLVMGATASMLWWPVAMMTALAAGGYQVIRFDHRDTGQSSTHPPGELTYDIHDMANDVIAVLDGYGVGKAHLVGMSLGGLLIQIDALRHRERVASLTLIASEPLGLNYEGEGIDEKFMAHFEAMSRLDWTDEQSVADFLVKSVELSAGTAVPFDAVAARERVEAELVRTGSIQSSFNHGSVTGVLDGLSVSDLDLPTLVIHGSEDPIIAPAAGKAIASAVPGAELIILERRGHEILDQDVDTISAAILKLADGTIPHGRRD